MPKFILLTKKQGEVVLCAEEIEWFQELKNDKLTEVKMKSGDIHFVEESVQLIREWFIWIF